MHIVFLAHRTPYPPIKGEKIRAWHFLRYLARFHKVSLGYFEDDRADREHRDLLRGRMNDICVVETGPRRLRRRSMLGLLTANPLSVAAYPKRQMQSFVRQKAREGADLIIAYSGVSAAMIPADVKLPIVLDLVDVDSAKYAAYASDEGPFMSWVYGREARLLADFERMAAARARVTTCVSDAEVDLFKQNTAAHVAPLPNGVDTVVFDPTRFHLREESDSIRLIFTGVMTYRPNVDAMMWFVSQVWPILNRETEWELIIAGGPVAPEIEKMSDIEGIYVTGSVPEMQPILAEADIAIAPLRIARGVQNKIMEAMAMALPVVATPEAAEGILSEPPMVVADTAGAFAGELDKLAQVIQVRRDIGQQNRRWVRENMSWDAAYKRLDSLISKAISSES